MPPLSPLPATELLQTSLQVGGTVPQRLKQEVLEHAQWKYSLRAQQGQCRQAVSTVTAKTVRVSGQRVAQVLQTQGKWGGSFNQQRALGTHAHVRFLPTDTKT